MQFTGFMVYKKEHHRFTQIGRDKIKYLCKSVRSVVENIEVFVGCLQVVLFGHS